METRTAGERKRKGKTWRKEGRGGQAKGKGERDGKEQERITGR